MLLLNVIKNDFLVITTQIRIFQPNQIALIFYTINNDFYIRYFREDGRDKTGRTHSDIMKYFHCCKASFYADCFVHIVFEIFVQYEKLFATVFIRIFERFQMFHVQKSSLRLCMPGKTFHKGRIEVFAGVCTANIWVDGIVTNRQVGFCDYIFYNHLLYNH